MCCCCCFVFFSKTILEEKMQNVLVLKKFFSVFFAKHFINICEIYSTGLVSVRFTCKGKMYASLTRPACVYAIKMRCISISQHMSAALFMTVYPAACFYGAIRAIFNCNDPQDLPLQLWKPKLYDLKRQHLPPHEERQTACDVTQQLKPTVLSSVSEVQSLLLVLFTSEVCTLYCACSPIADATPLFTNFSMNKSIKKSFLL